MFDDYTDIIGLQLKSLYSSAVEGGASTHGNRETIRNSILEGGNSSIGNSGSNAAVSVDAESAIINSLLISHGIRGAVFKYAGYLLHDTIINPDECMWLQTGYTRGNTSLMTQSSALRTRPPLRMKRI